MDSKPIIFSSYSVRAILAGRKSMTRRIIKPQPPDGWTPVVGYYHPMNVDRHGEEYPGEAVFGAADEDAGRVCPYGPVGSRLWCKESVAIRADADPAEDLEKARHYLLYRADRESGDGLSDEWHNYGRGWRSPLMMPRWACRLVLEITEVRVEKLNEITALDAIDEGALSLPNRPTYASECEAAKVRGERKPPIGDGPVERFARAWDALNAKRGFPWSSNPWCWVVTFRRLPSPDAP